MLSVVLKFTDDLKRSLVQFCVCVVKSTYSNDCFHYDG